MFTTNTIHNPEITHYADHKPSECTSDVVVSVGLFTFILCAMLYMGVSAIFRKPMVVHQVQFAPVSVNVNYTEK